MKRTKLIAGVIAITSMSGLAAAGFVNEDIPSWRGDANTAYGGWNSFSTPLSGPNFANEGNMGFASQLFLHCLKIVSIFTQYTKLLL